MKFTPTAHAPGLRIAAAGLALALGGCTALAPQLPPTDFAQLEGLETREAREYAYEQNRVELHRDKNGLRFTKGDDPNAPKLGWQSLDSVLRSEKHASSALPDKKRRLVRVFTGLTFASALASTAGVAGTAREGLDTSSLSGSSGLLLFGGLLTVGFAITSGILYGQMRRDYVQAVDIYNDSLGLRLGLYDPAGKYIPPAGTVLDEEGFVVLSDSAAEAGPAPEPEPEPEAPAEPPAEPEPEPIVSPGDVEGPAEADPNAEPASAPAPDSDPDAASDSAIVPPPERPEDPPQGGDPEPPPVQRPGGDPPEAGADGTKPAGPPRLFLGSR